MKLLSETPVSEVFFHKPSPALCPCSPDLPQGYCNIPCRTTRGKDLHIPTRFPAPQPVLRALAPALLSQSCSCSPSASPPLTQTRANMPTVSLATVQKPCDSFFLRSWSNTNHKIHMRKSLWCDPALNSPTCAGLKTFSPGNTLRSDFYSLPMGKF